MGVAQNPLFKAKIKLKHTQNPMIKSHATTTSPKPSFKAPWRVGEAVVARGDAGWTTSKTNTKPRFPELFLRKKGPDNEAKSFHQRVEDTPVHARTAHKGLLQKKRLEEDLCWIVPYVPPTIQSGNGLN